MLDYFKEYDVNKIIIAGSLLTLSLTTKQPKSIYLASSALILASSYCIIKSSKFFSSKNNEKTDDQKPAKSFFQLLKDSILSKSDYLLNNSIVIFASGFCAKVSAFFISKNNERTKEQKNCDTEKSLLKVLKNSIISNYCSYTFSDLTPLVTSNIYMKLGIRLYAYAFTPLLYKTFSDHFINSDKQVSSHKIDWDSFTIKLRDGILVETALYMILPKDPFKNYQSLIIDFSTRFAVYSFKNIMKEYNKSESKEEFRENPEGAATRLCKIISDPNIYTNSLLSTFLHRFCKTSLNGAVDYLSETHGFNKSVSYFMGDVVANTFKNYAYDTISPIISV